MIANRKRAIAYEKKRCLPKTETCRKQVLLIYKQKTTSKCPKTVLYVVNNKIIHFFYYLQQYI